MCRTRAIANRNQMFDRLLYLSRTSPSAVGSELAWLTGVALWMLAGLAILVLAAL
jgi:hypothetical protein